MANNYNDILTLVNAGNQMGLSNTIKRDYGIPLDFTSVQESYDAAVIYAATSTLAYVGQTVAVGGKLYIISDAANGTHTVGEGEDAKTYDNYLAEVGSKTEGDGNTIELDGQTLKLAGLTGLDNSKTYVPSLVNGKLVWAEPSATTVEGLDTRLQAVEGKVTTVEGILNGTEETGGLVDKVADNTQAIADETAAREAAIGAPAAGETPASGVYGAFAAADADILAKIGDLGDNTTVAAMIAAAEQSAKDAIPTDNAAFTNGAGYQTASDVSDAISTAIANKADKATTLAGYGITDAYTKDEVNSAISSMTHMSTKVVAAPPSAETAEAGVIYLVADDDAAGAYIEYILVEHDDGSKTVEQIGSTATDLTDYAKSADVVAKTDFETFQTENTAAIADAKKAGTDAATALAEYKTATDAALEGKVETSVFDTFKTSNTNAIATAKQEAIDAAAAAEEAKGYAVASDIASTYAAKATTLAGYGITDAYTKAETVAKTDVYTKTEVDKLLDEVSGGSSETAASVKRALDGYIQNMDTEVYGAETVASWTDAEGAYSPTYAASTSRIDTAIANAASAQTTADQAAQSAETANTAITTLTNGQVKTNKDNIATLTTIISGASAEDKNALTYRVGALETVTGTHTAELSALTGSVDTLVKTTIPGVKAIADKNAEDIVTINNTLNGVEGSEGLIATVAKKANAVDVYTKSETDAKVITSGEVARGDTDSVAIANNKITVTLNSYTKGEVDALLENLDQTELEEGIAANAAAIKVLNGYVDAENDGDTGKSVRAIAKEEAQAEVAALVGEAPEALNTVHEIASWIENDETGAAAMATKIEANSAILVGIGGDGQPATVTAAIATAKQEAIDAASFTLTVATAETLGGVKSSTDENKVAVAADGVMEVNSVNVNKLTQTAGDVLILNGGSAAG